MDVKWGNLADVFVASLGITIVVVVMFSLGIVAWARSGPGPAVRRRGPRPVGAVGAVAAPRRRTAQQWLAAAVAVLCFAVCLAVAGYGIALIVPG